MGVARRRRQKVTGGGNAALAKVMLDSSGTAGRRTRDEGSARIRLARGDRGVGDPAHRRREHNQRHENYSAKEWEESTTMVFEWACPGAVDVERGLLTAASGEG